jgi:hypothetical protein
LGDATAAAIEGKTRTEGGRKVEEGRNEREERRDRREFVGEDKHETGAGEGGLKNWCTGDEGSREKKGGRISCGREAGAPATFSNLVYFEGWEINHPQSRCLHFTPFCINCTS